MEMVKTDMVGEKHLIINKIDKAKDNGLTKKQVLKLQEELEVLDDKIKKNIFNKLKNFDVKSKIKMTEFEKEERYNKMVKKLKKDLDNKYKKVRDEYKDLQYKVKANVELKKEMRDVIKDVKESPNLTEEQIRQIRKKYL